ncbi:hypothetical protein PMSD_23415 [Paenibacillus macquariensis subsp. defensor]|nr:hypothetical protein PMSD_23415 [Paenibacillus macquariensis subsp. defensor]
MDRTTPFIENLNKPTARGRHIAVLIGDGIHLAFGGEAGDRPYSQQATVCLGLNGHPGYEGDMLAEHNCLLNRLQRIELQSRERADPAIDP